MEIIKSYQDFLKSKRISAENVGFDITDSEINRALYPFQRDIVRWACKRGRAAMFEDCGLGKTPQQLEWARLVLRETGGTALIVAPLAVSRQTVREGIKFGIDVVPVRHGEEVQTGKINITNYEMLHHFDPSKIAAIVLDESSILKSFDGTYRQMITDFAAIIPYRLACTATPAPNDLIEIINHADFLGIMQEREIKALFFRLDGKTTHNYILKGHAEKEFWEWLASWAVAIRAPSDVGYEDGSFTLPACYYIEHVVKGKARPGDLFAMEAVTLPERRQARKDSLDDRVAVAAALANADGGQWLIWCNLNAESTALTKAINGAVEVTGSDTNEHKEETMLGFSDGTVRVIVTKPRIAGFGMNWQQCHNMAFVGLSDSYEQFYQATRRCWRFGQTQPVNVHIVIADTEGAVRENIRRKDTQASKMFEEIVIHMKSLQLDKQNAQQEEMEYTTGKTEGQGWTIYNGDSVEVIDKIESNSVGLAVFSPPFPGMYAYTNSARDMGNVKSMGEMIEQFAFLAAPEKLLRVLMPGRTCAIHLCQGVSFKGTDGHAGLKDFRGAVIQVMEDAGWIYYGEVCIDKDPQIKAIRTKDSGLMFKSLATDSARMHMAMADYILQFKKRGDNPEQIKAGISTKYKNPDGWITSEEWIEWAAPVWYRQTKEYPGGIRETDVLNRREGREDKDEKHICPLQLGVVERCVKLWSAPGDLVFSPFAGIGSEGYVAVKFNRRFVGIELKRSYYETAIRNLGRAVQDKDQVDLFDLAVATESA